VNNSNSRGIGKDTTGITEHDFDLISSAVGNSALGETSSSSISTGSGNSAGSSAFTVEQMQMMMGSPKVYKHISIHIPPKEEFDVPMRRLIRPMNQPDKHVNIIFVKAPSSSSAQQTEVILPEQNEQRTVVYVLLKKSEPGQNDIKIRQPQPSKPPRPEVFFVQYGNKDQSLQRQIGSGSARNVGSDNVSRPEYGVPN
jgi:hypothetical protein